MKPRKFGRDVFTDAVGKIILFGTLVILLKGSTAIEGFSGKLRVEF